LSVYADTSFLVSLYAPDVNSAAAVALMRRLPLPIMISHFGELEFINATQLRLFRNELPSAKVRAAYAAFRDDVAGGVVSLVPTTEAIYAEARRISLRWSRMLGTRTVDVMHVASALVLRADAFHTFDERQRRLARAVKLTTA
jgi:predicted nucleic acid-binding protein